MGLGDTRWRLNRRQQQRTALVAQCAGTVAFGPFELFPRSRELRTGDGRVTIGSRALEILLLLVERAGEVVSADEIYARVWPGVFVAETNLRVNISALRKALGEGRAGNASSSTCRAGVIVLSAPIRAPGARPSRREPRGRKPAARPAVSRSLGVTTPSRRSLPPAASPLRNDYGTRRDRQDDGGGRGGRGARRLLCGPAMLRRSGSADRRRTGAQGGRRRARRAGCGRLAGRLAHLPARARHAAGARLL